MSFSGRPGRVASATGEDFEAVGRWTGRVLSIRQAGQLKAIQWECEDESCVADFYRASDSGEPVRAPNGDAAFDIEQRLREAYEKGIADGRQEARTAARTEYRDAIERLAQAAARLQEHRIQIRREAEEELVRLAIAVARRLIRRELTVDPESVHGIIRIALEKIQARDISRVRVHPSQSTGVQEMLGRIAGAKNLEVVADPSLDLGDAVFETSRSDLDATIDSQLREIERGFVDRLPK